MRNEIKAIIKKLEDTLEKVEDYLDNAESAEYPNDDRIEDLQYEIYCIQEAIDSLENLE